MTVELDHTIVPSRHKVASAKQAAGIPYSSDVRGPQDMRINTDHGGRMLYWNEPDGHQWEMLTVSYAREPRPAV
jgi:hypothetical protein